LPGFVPVTKADHATGDSGGVVLLRGEKTDLSLSLEKLGNSPWSM